MEAIWMFNSLFRFNLKVSDGFFFPKLKRDVKLFHFCIFSSNRSFQLETMIGEWNPWIGRKMTKFSTHFSGSTWKWSLWSKTQNWCKKFKKSIFVFFNSIRLVYPQLCKSMQKHAKQIEKSAEWKRSDVKSAKHSGKMDVPSMFGVVSMYRGDRFGK